MRASRRGFSIKPETARRPHVKHPSYKAELTREHSRSKNPEGAFL